MLVSRGEKFRRHNTAQRWNDVERMLQEWLGGRLKFGGEGSLSPYAPSVVWVKNISQNDVAPGDVLGLGDPVISPTDNLAEFKSRLAFEGSIPSISTPHYGQYGVVQESARKTDGFCRCVVAGVTFVKLNITHAADRACEIANNVSTALTTGYIGTSRILWKESGTGAGKWGLIRVGDTLDYFFGKASGAIASGSTTGTVDVWTPTFSGAVGPQVTGCSNPGAALVDDDKVSGVLVQGVPAIGKIC